MVVQYVGLVVVLHVGLVVVMYVGLVVLYVGLEISHK